MTKILHVKTCRLYKMGGGILGKGGSILTFFLKSQVAFEENILHTMSRGGNPGNFTMEIGTKNFWYNLNFCWDG